MVSYIKKLKQERADAVQVVAERLPRGLTEAEKQVYLEKKQVARNVLKRNILKICSEKFPDIVGNVSIWKWAQQCDREGWEHIPESDRKRWREVPNAWRAKMKLPKKGRSKAGKIPAVIECELDKLVAQHVMGMSDITERKEVVSWADMESGAAKGAMLVTSCTTAERTNT